ncbi:MAG: redoxin domain-containing protein [Ignavibacteria bacterium]|jgi:thiol-disulfide isomerase/thioredoxin
MSKKICVTIIIILLFKTMCFAQENNDIFSYSPSKPIPGEELTISFNPQNTELSAEQNIEVIIYSLMPEQINSCEYPMEKNGTIWNYKYKIPDTANCIALRFKGGEKEVYDDGRNFPVFLYDENGKLKAGTRSAFADICFKGNYNARPDMKLAYSLYQKEFNDNPSMIKYSAELYSVCVMQLDRANHKNILIDLVKNLEAEKDLNEKTIKNIWFIYSLLQDQEKIDYYMKLSRERYPLGEMSKSYDFNEMKNRISDPDSLARAINEYRVKYKVEGGRIISIKGKLLKLYCQHQMYDQASKYLQANIDEFNSNLESIKAIYQAAVTVADAGINPDFSKELIGIALKLITKNKPEKKDLFNKKVARDEALWRHNKIEALYYSGLVYEKIEEPEKAIQFIEEAYSYGESSFDGKLKKIQVRLLLDLNKDIDKALKITEDMLTNEGAKEEISDLNKKAYILLKESDEGYESYLNGLKKLSNKNIAENIKAEMINIKASAFRLKDLEGNNISLSDFKGQIVILDFWATWCAPCKASMPYMKQSVEKYASDSNVKFLFIDTFEKLAGSKEAVAKFIKSKDYPFHVLLDTDNKVAEAYGVSAIPTKIFIDKNQSIRYISIGLEHENIPLEIDALIEMLN